jgi:hypothetical protein
MGIFSNFFNEKNQIDEKLENINILRLTMRQNEALIQTRNLIAELMRKPSLLNGMKEIGEFGNFLTHQLNNFQQNDEIQFIVEIAFFASTKAINKEMHPNNIYDRLIIMYNAEDFLIDTVKQANDLQYNPLSRMGSMYNIKYMAEDMLLKMRYHDLLQENKFYRNGANDSSFNGQEFIEISDMIINGRFESKSKDEIAQKGKVFIEKCYEYVARKYSLNT